MRFLLDRVALRNEEIRVIGYTDRPETEVWTSRYGFEFPNRNAALHHVAMLVREAVDMRGLQPGQQVSLPMQQGQIQTVNVISNSEEGIIVADPQSGQQMQIPHAPQTPPPPGTPKKPGDPTAQPQGQEQGGGNEGGDNYNIQPGTGTRTYSLSKSSWKGEWRPPEHPERKKDLSKKQASEDDEGHTDQVCTDCDTGIICESCGVCHTCQDSNKDDGKKEAADFPHRRPNNCKHDGDYLQSHDKGDAEKECPSCGMMYAATRKEGVTPRLQGWPGRKYYFCPQCNTSRTVMLDKDGDEIHRALQNGKVVRLLSCKHPTVIEEEPSMPTWNPVQRQAKVTSQCATCGTPITYNNARNEFLADNGDASHEHRPTSDIRNVPDRMPARKPMGPPRSLKDRGWGRAYSLSKKQAQAPGMVGPQSDQAGLAIAAPQGPMQAPAGDQPQPKQTPGGRPLSRHEIITEAEILIRNALFKGIKIGTMDLVKYMQGQYGNAPEELYEGATKAWEKVQWEEQEQFEQAKGPGPQQKEQQPGPGAEPEESPVSLEDIAEEPGAGPAQVRL